MYIYHILAIFVRDACRGHLTDGQLCVRRLTAQSFFCYSVISKCLIPSQYTYVSVSIQTYRSIFVCIYTYVYICIYGGLWRA